MPTGTPSYLQEKKVIPALPLRPVPPSHSLPASSHAVRAPGGRGRLCPFSPPAESLLILRIRLQSRLLGQPPRHPYKGKPSLLRGLATRRPEDSDAGSARSQQGPRARGPFLRPRPAPPRPAAPQAPPHATQAPRDARAARCPFKAARLRSRLTAWRVLGSSFWTACACAPRCIVGPALPSGTLLAAWRGGERL